MIDERQLQIGAKVMLREEEAEVTALITGQILINGWNYAPHQIEPKPVSEEDWQTFIESVGKDRARRIRCGGTEIVEVMTERLTLTMWIRYAHELRLIESLATPSE